jgi:hypothetical protein
MTRLRGRLKPDRHEIVEKNHGEKGLKLVYIEGGLGSQIIPYLQYKYLVDRGTEVYADVSYFEINENIKYKKKIADHWSYRLDRYGVDLYRLKLRPSSDVSNVRDFSDWNRDFWQWCRVHGSSLLPVDIKKLNFLLHELDITAGEDYSVVHVRKGDYLRVASRVITDDMWFTLVKNLLSVFTKRLLIVSDGLISVEIKNELIQLSKEANIRVQFLEATKHDECDLHDLIRMAKTIVTSNSTFSFTAGLLAKKETSVYCPIDFYDPSSLDFLNVKLRESGTFFVMD